MPTREKKCLIHANCQGEPLEGLLRAHPVFGAEYDISTFVNYTRQPVSDRDLAETDVFLYQYLGPGWDDLASENLLKMLPRHCRAVCIPNLFFKHYWPLFDNEPGMDYSDRLLNALIAKGLSTREIVHLYVHADIGRFHDLELLAEESLEHEREKERHWDFKMVDMVLEQFKSRWLFKTVNHPGRSLSFHVAARVLEILDEPPFTDGTMESYPEPFGEFELPIHPQVAEHFGLEFLEPNQKFNCYGTPITFVEYVNYYIECKMRGLDSFIAYLQLRPGMGREEARKDREEAHG